MDENGPAPRYLRIVIAAVLASLATVVVLGAVLLLAGRDDNAPIRVLLPAPTQNEAVELRVYVRGAVRNPGVHTLRPEDRWGMPSRRPEAPPAMQLWQRPIWPAGSRTKSKSTPGRWARPFLLVTIPARAQGRPPTETLPVRT